MPEIYDLTSPAHRQLLSQEIHRQIDLYCQEVYDDGPRSHLGASLIGHPCNRYLWYTFRWVFHKKHSGRMYRLFDRGHREEERFVKWLKGVGFEVTEFDTDWQPDDVIRIGQHKGKTIKDVPSDYIEWAKKEGVDLCKKQYRISGCNGHFGGSLDGLAVIPAVYVPTGERILVEFKTSGTGSKKFGKMQENGLKEAKPQHFSQVSIYGKKYNIKYVLYLMINKDTDDLHVELEAVDWVHGAEMERKAEYIIGSQEEPPRMCKSESHWEAKYCDYLGVCFKDHKLDKNCRSCKWAWPIENAQWGCEKWNCEIPLENIKEGCDSWESIC